MNTYELLYIVPTQYTDDEVGEIEKKVSGLVEKVGGKVASNTNLGKIRLAYPIKKVRHGTYILSYFEAEGEQVAELDRQLRLADEVLRHTIVDRPEGADSSSFELSSYVAPLSEEAKAQRKPKARTERKVATPATPAAPEAIAPPAPSATSAEESKMTMEELDQKLDKILEGDIAENI